MSVYQPSSSSMSTKELPDGKGGNDGPPEKPNKAQRALNRVPRALCYTFSSLYHTLAQYTPSLLYRLLDPRLSLRSLRELPSHSH